ncbi:hypothetical protein TURU_121570 [Turdus rufiventris]|nr:hypothetical protein TURU_121570 [Turdus rufiventris]
MSAHSRMGSQLAKAEPISESSFDIMCLRRGKKQLHRSNCSQSTEESEYVREAALQTPRLEKGQEVLQAEKQIPLQPVVQPMVRKAVPLQPMQGHGGAEIRDSPTTCGDPAPKQVDTQRRL